MASSFGFRQGAVNSFWLSAMGDCCSRAVHGFHFAVLQAHIYCFVRALDCLVKRPVLSCIDKGRLDTNRTGAAGTNCWCRTNWVLPAMLQGVKGVKYGLTVPDSKKKKKPALGKPAACSAFGDDGSDEDQHEAVPQQLARHAASKKSDSKVREHTPACIRLCDFGLVLNSCTLHFKCVAQYAVCTISKATGAPLVRISLAASVYISKSVAEIAPQSELSATRVACVQVKGVHAAALAEDPSVFDYDGVYDSMQETKAAPVAAARAQRSSKYIENLLDKAKERQREQDIIYERRCVHIIHTLLGHSASSEWSLPCSQRHAN